MTATAQTVVLVLISEHDRNAPNATSTTPTLHRTTREAFRFLCREFDIDLRTSEQIDGLADLVQQINWDNDLFVEVVEMKLPSFVEVK